MSLLEKQDAYGQINPEFEEVGSGNCATCPMSEQSYLTLLHRWSGLTLTNPVSEGESKIFGIS
jgi:hypothetical protein